ncbi:MAG: cellulase family glycosylhydrolase, partial [Roseiflexaceae bacterium]|nr:cellulase family glycosylhydrolase [Roseiflexaceae bacterium]
MTQFRTPAILGAVISFFAILLRRMALLGVLLGCLAVWVWLDNAANRGITFAPAAQPIAYADGPQLGVNAYNIQFEPEQAKVLRTLDLARELGARYVRLHMPWSDVEIHAKGDFADRRNGPPVSAWAKYDFLFTAMRERGLEPIVRLDRPPEWARPKAIATPEWQAILAVNPNADSPPDNAADYADFVAAVAARYAGQVRFLQLWNEPNLADEWGGKPPDVAQFLALFRQASAAARAANPQVVILFPSLAPTDGLDLRGPITDLEFLDATYQLGGAASFDILSAQAYGLGQPPDEHRYVAPRRPFSWRR